MGSLWAVQLTFRDTDGNERQAQVHTNAATTVAALVALAQGFEDAASQISNAAIVGGRVTTRWANPLQPAGLQSDVRRKALLLSRETSATAYRYGSLVVPSPRPQLWDSPTDGLYKVSRGTAQAALRTQIDNLLGLGWLGVNNEPVPIADWAYALMSEP